MQESLTNPADPASSPRHHLEDEPIFKEPPAATVIEVSRAEGNDLSRAFQLVYSIQLEYQGFKWRLERKAAQVFFLHLALKRQALLQDLQEKQEQVKEWVQSLGLGEHSPSGVNLHSHDDYDQEDNPPAPRKDIPSSAALPVMRPALGRLPTISHRAQSAMQHYLKHFLDNLDIVNTREVCRFLEVSKLSFAPEYGPKLREGYVMVQHLPKFSTEDSSGGCLNCFRICHCCSPNWQQVWAVLKPGFLALLVDPTNPKPLDIIVFDVLVPSDRGATDGLIALARMGKERNPLRFSFLVTCGNRVVKFRTQQARSARDWVAGINDAGLRPPEGWCHPHRFGSFAPPRGLGSDGTAAQWFIDGKAAFEAIAVAIDDAKSEIFLAGWWVCPDLYLRRPFSAHESSRLDTLLEAKAKSGVQIYVLLYKEVALALKINSNYTKQRLLSIHENIKVLRYPDHFSSGVYLWSHHEKLIIVDHQVCFIGGLDLCFGRYDSPEHRVSDYPVSLWPGKDYYNPRESEPNSWEESMKDQLDREKYPRMPWHDVHCALWGPPCRDVARHFVQRWNYAKRSKAPNEHAIPLLLPQHHMVIPHYLTGWEATESHIEAEHALQRQVSEKEQLVSARSSYEDIPLLLPKEEEQDPEMRENTLNFKSSSREFIGIMPLNGMMLRYPSSSEEERLLSSEVQMHTFVEDPEVGRNSGRTVTDSGRLKDQVSSIGNMNHTTDQEWWEVEQRELGEMDFNLIGEAGPRSRCKCQVIRSVGQWSAGTSQLEEHSIHTAYCSLIEKAEFFVYIENQFFISGLDSDDIIHNRVLQALYTRIMRAHEDRRCFRVIVVMPLLPGFQGGVDDSGAASVRAIMHWQYRTICRGRQSLLQRLLDRLGPDLENYISFYGLRNHGKLYENGPLSTSQIYVHSKIMIVDDRTVLIGSANINDRSLLGSRDSELGVVIEDTDYIQSTMNGNIWNAGRFAHSLRMSLWAEHLGIRQAEIDLVKDPVSNATYRGVWMSRAESNTRLYDSVFGSIPSDSIHSRVALRLAVAQQKEKVGHTTIDLGIAPKDPDQAVVLNKGEGLSMSQESCIDAICGHLVFFPLEFMADEDLRPVFKESEYYASAQIFH
jgi:phospholipase D1/2